MAVTYVGDLSTDLDKVRFYIQDTVENSGPKPSDGNFTDDELNGLINSVDNWTKAVAEAFRVLSAAWSGYADITAGPRRESFSRIAEQYAKRAEEWSSESLETGYITMTFAEHETGE